MNNSIFTEEERRRLQGFFSLLLKVDKTVEGWKKRLENEPEGFVLEGQYSCGNCHVYGTDSLLYTRHGIRCEECRDVPDEDPLPKLRFGGMELIAYSQEYEESWLLRHAVVCNYCYLVNLALYPVPREFLEFSLRIWQDYL